MEYPIGFMDMALYTKLIDEIAAYPDRTLVLFRRGEALLHPEFTGMLNYVKGKFKDIQLATNASLMDKALARNIADCVTFVSFSLELPERYQRYRQLDYATVLKNVDYFLSVNKNAKTQVSIVKTDDTSPEDIERFREQWLNKVERVRVYEEHSGDGRFGSLKGPSRSRKPCLKPFNELLIFWDGKIGRCNHDWGEAPLDSVADKSIKEVWQSRAYQDLRKQHSDLNIADEVCKNCDSWYEHTGECEIGQVYEKDK